MHRNRTPILIAALLAGALAPAAASAAADQAQAGATERRIVTRHDIVAQVYPAHPDEMTIHDGLSPSAPLIHSERGVVKGRPYSTDIISEQLQQLADGNQIRSRTRLKTYRDSAGRTRTEIYGPDDKVNTITIYDPVDHVRWLLAPKRMQAHRIQESPAAARAAAERARAAAEQARGSAEQARIRAEQARLAADQAREKIAQLRSEGKLPEGRRVIVTETRRDNDRKEMRVRVAEPDPASLAITREMSSQIGPMITRAAGDRKWAATAVTRDLGTREVSGVMAQGRLRSYEIPAGEIGNRDPITVSSETWTSQELQLTVYHKHSDPRSGELVYRLEGLRRDEPPADLFTVPAGYKVFAQPRADTRPAPGTGH